MASGNQTAPQMSRLGIWRRKYFGPITQVRTQKPIAALTFDDGPGPEFTPLLLEVLERHQAKATFFVVGEAAQRHPQIVEAMAEAGHAVGNHSHTHCDFLTVPFDRQIREIRSCSQALGEYGEKIFRPPYGRENFASHLAARSLGYRVVKWTISTGDWTGISSDEIYQRMHSALRPGAIILLHDSSAKTPSADRSPTIAAVDRLLREAADYDFVTVPELFADGQPLSRPMLNGRDLSQPTERLQSV